MRRTGELVRTVRERCRTDDVLAAVETLGAVRPEVPKLLIWDNAPPHIRTACGTPPRAGITLAFLPFRSPELMPLEELWRGLKATVAANRCYASLEELAERAMAWLDGMSDAERLRRCGLHPPSSSGYLLRYGRGECSPWDRDLESAANTG